MQRLLENVMLQGCPYCQYVFCHKTQWEGQEVYPDHYQHRLVLLDSTNPQCEFLRKFLILWLCHSKNYNSLQCWKGRRIYHLPSYSWGLPLCHEVPSLFVTPTNFALKFDMPWIFFSLLIRPFHVKLKKELLKSKLLSTQCSIMTSIFFKHVQWSAMSI